MFGFLRPPLRSLEGNLFAVQTISLKLLFVLPMFEYCESGQETLGYWLKSCFFHAMSWFTMLLPLHMVLLVSKTVYDMDNGNLQVISAYAIEAVWFLFSFVGVVYFNVQRSRLEHLIDLCNANFKWRSERGKTFVNMSKSYNLAKWVAITWTSVTAFSVWCSTIDPLFKGERELSVDCWYPVDKKDTLNYTIIFILQMWAKLVMVVSFSSGSSLYVTFIIYCCSQYDCLFCSLKNIFYTCGIYSTLPGRSKDGNREEFSEYFYSTEVYDDFFVDENYNKRNNKKRASFARRSSSLNAAAAAASSDEILFSKNNKRKLITRRQQQTEKVDVVEEIVGDEGGFSADDGFGDEVRSDDVTATNVSNHYALATAASISLNAVDIEPTAHIEVYIEAFRAALRTCVDQHNNIVHVCNLMEDFFHPFAFLRLSEMTLQLCFVAYVLVFTEIPTSSYLTLLTFLIFTLVDLYLLTYPAEYLGHQSLSVGEALMRSPWNLMMRYFKNDFLIMLTFASRPVKMTALRIFILNADRLRVVVGTAFSYFTLLSSFNQN